MNTSKLQYFEQFRAFAEFMHDKGFEKIPKKREKLEEFIQSQNLDYLTGLKLALDNSPIKRNLIYRKTYNLVSRKLDSQEKIKKSSDFFYNLCLVK